MFGELSLFDPGPAHRDRDGGHRHHARSGSGTTTSSRGCTGRPEVAPHLLRALARRLRRTNEALADLVFTDVPGRVAKALLDLSERFGAAARTTACAWRTT